jgi:hypothetical protein
MKLTCQIIAGLLLLYWPMGAMFSPMAFAAGSSTHKSILPMVGAMLFYPVLIALCFYALNWSFLFMSARTFLIVSIALPIGVCFLFGYPRLVYQMYRGIDTNGYCIKETAVYYGGTELHGIDLATLSVMEADGRYARDRAHVFYDGKPIEGADSTTFGEVLQDGEPTTFWRDAKHVYYGGKRVAAADPATFQVLGVTAYARDQVHAYHRTELIQGADGSSFELINESFARDKARIYFLGEPILLGADAASFELLPTSNYGRDTSKVYALPNALFRTAHELSGADRATFTPLARAYAKDSKYVYFADDGRAVPVESADPASFRVTEWDEASKSEARDNQRYYLQGKVVRAQ